jgi:hypothetical protein
MSDQESLEITTPIQAKAVQIGRYYQLHDLTEVEAWSDAGKSDSLWEKTLETVGDEAIKRAHALEDSLAKDKPTTLIDALILAAQARNLAGAIDEATLEGTSKRDLLWVRQIVDNITRFLEASTGKGLEALGLSAWGDWGEDERREIEREAAPLDAAVREAS